MTRKKRILWVGDASFLNTGYAKYGLNLLKRLYDTGKYEIAELGCYGHWADNRRFNIPWTYYGNLHNSDSKSIQDYQSNQINQFGYWRFEETCLDFKPDVLMSILDPWMNSYQADSPYRKLYDMIIMPTIDSIGQDEEWLNMYADADIVFTYSQFGKKTLEEETSGNIKVSEVAPYGIDFDTFRPVRDKRQFKDSMGLIPSINVVGTIMRNQSRKLYPALIKAFQLYIEKYPEQAEEKQVYLYLHVSHPDTGWDIPLLIKESNISNRILLTYICRNCGHSFPALFQDARHACTNCHKPTAYLPNYQYGVNEQQLSGILNLFDLYVQYAKKEGLGMPQIEAGACGVPVAAVNYSAMESVVKELNGFPINIKHMERESGSNGYLAHPDDEHLADIIYRFFNMPETVRMKRGRDALNGVKKYYNWDDIAKKWENAIDSLELQDRWNYTPVNINNPAINIPNNLTNEDFVKWCVVNVWGEPSRINDYKVLRIIKDLNYGVFNDNSVPGYHSELSFLSGQKIYSSFTHETAYNKLKQMTDIRNYWEKRRAGTLEESPSDFILNKKVGI